MSTPAAHWRDKGEEDPHKGYYDGERSTLPMGHLTDDELANELYLKGDIQPSIESLLSGKAVRPIVWLQAAKDRIRWLSRKLEYTLNENQRLRELLKKHSISE